VSPVRWPTVSTTDSYSGLNNPKNRLMRKWQITRDPAVKAEVNRLQRSMTNQLTEWRNYQWSNTLESLDTGDQQSWKIIRQVLRIPTESSSLPTLGRLALSDSDKAEALADNLEAQFQPVNNTSVPASLTFNKEMQAYSLAPANEPWFKTPLEVS